MDAEQLIHEIYASQPQLEAVLLTHSRQVRDLALSVCDTHPELNLNRDFVEEASMLHDIGIIHTNAPRIFCFGSEPYLCHGLIGGKMLRERGLNQHARVAERHTGTGLRKEEIIRRNLPLPHEDFVPETMEEQVICYADKFFSKTHLDKKKTVEAVLHSLSDFGDECTERFLQWHKLFGN